jgi:hypothetical protein
MKAMKSMNVGRMMGSLKRKRKATATTLKTLQMLTSAAS